VGHLTIQLLADKRKPPALSSQERHLRDKNSSGDSQLMHLRGRLFIKETTRCNSSSILDTCTVEVPIWTGN
jgi:hypothetical protein